MTPRCSLCGTFESENLTILSSADVCYACIDSLVESEIERKAVGTCEFCDKPIRGIDEGAILGTHSVCWDCLGILVIDEHERRDEEGDAQLLADLQSCADTLAHKQEQARRNK